MGLFDNISGFFTGQTAQDAADKQKAGLTQAYGQASDLLGQGRGALTSNYTAGLQPFIQNYGTATAGTAALTDALGITGDPSQVKARFQNTPGYQFQLEQGNENVLRNASRTGQGNSGAVNLDLQKQGQGLANSTYQQYVQNLMPFLGAGAGAAGGIGQLYSGLGQGLAGSYGTQANAAYGTQAGIGNAEANAELAKNSGVANILGLGQNILGLGSNTIGGTGAKKLFGFEGGGRPPVGQPSIVGERGPEVFVPDRPGYVVPNWMLDAGVGGASGMAASGGRKMTRSIPRPEVGPFPDMGNPIRPNPLAPSFNLNMGAPDRGAGGMSPSARVASSFRDLPLAPSAQPNTLAGVLLQAMSKNGFSFPAR